MIEEQKKQGIIISIMKKKKEEIIIIQRLREIIANNQEMKEIRLKQNSDININNRRDIPNNIYDSNSSDSENTLPLRNGNISCRNNNLSKVEHLRNYLREDLGEHLISNIGFEKGIEVFEYYADEDTDNNLENLINNNLKIRHNDFDPTFNFEKKSNDEEYEFSL